jgi:ABC-type sugar transport system substrate-binding protein
MKQKTIIALLVIIMMLVGVTACSTPKTQESAESASQSKVTTEATTETTMEATTEGKRIGYLAFSLADVWDQYGNDCAIWAAESVGVEVTTFDSEGNPETQVNQAEELINSGVDGIILFPCTPESGATIVRMGNEANIPVAIRCIFLSDDVNTAGQAGFQYRDVGYTAFKYISEKFPGARVLFVHGEVGMGIHEDYMIGVEKALKDFEGKVSLTELLNGKWVTEASYNVTNDYLQAGNKDTFDVVFAANGMESKGVYGALRDNGIENIPIISTGGSPDDFEMFNDGIEYANMTIPPSFEGFMAFKYLWKAMNGIEVDEKSMALPVNPVDKTNVDEWIQWGDFQAASDYFGGLDSDVTTKK